MNLLRFRLAILFFLAIILNACVQDSTNIVFKEKDKNIIYFDNSESDTLRYQMDLDKNIYTGISIPSKKYDNSEHFKFMFKVGKRNSDKLFYKIFYQNSSYKFKETNKLSSENFYGSWENANEGFRQIDLKNIINGEYVDSFKIASNPRDEKKFKLPKVIYKDVTKEKVERIKSTIKNTPDWYSQIKEKAIKNNISNEEQLKLDAFWVINHEKSIDTVSNNWMRNPRAGDYELMLIVTTENELKKMPEFIRNISKKNSDSEYVNPFYYFLYGDGSKLKQTKVYKSDKIINVFAKLNFNSGMYLDLTELQKTNYKTNFINKKCDFSKEMFFNAQFEQYFHPTNKHYQFHSIPVVRDVMKSYTREDYNKNKSKFSEKERIKGFAQITDCPCKTASYDSLNSSFKLTNPAYKNEFRKENVGIRSRIGFTYGKYIAKIKFPKLINKSNVWNGLTNAFWLIYQDENSWNNRRECEGGYIPKGEDGKTGKREKENFYSEIDFEIVKASEFWPKSSYGNKSNYPNDKPEESDDIIVACTNWDLACPEPEDFFYGAKKFKYNNEKYEMHRWNKYYKAVTHKAVINHEWLLSGYTYYEIDWQPDKIIWRIGKDLNNMITICRMDENITSIPNNQMVIVITQEFHHGDWWPTTPFHQDNIPFQAKDFKGEIIEIMIK